MGSRWQARLAADRWVGIAWPAAYGGRGATPVEVALFNMEYARAGAPQPVEPRRHQPRRAHAAGPRHRGPAGAVAAADPRRLGALVPAVQRARRGQRPGLAHHASRTRHRSGRRTGLAGQRPEGVDQLRAVRPLGHRARAHRSGGREAPRHLLPRRRHAGAGGGGAAAAADDRGLRVQRGVPRLGVRAGRAPDRCAPRGVGGGGTTLAHERGTNFPFKEQVVHETYLDELWSEAARRGRLDDPEVADGLVDAFVELRLLRLHNWRTLSRLGRGLEPGPESSWVKLAWTDMTRDLSATALDVLGPERPAVGPLAPAVPLVARVVDRRRHLRGPEEHRRRTHPRPAALGNSGW